MSKIFLYWFEWQSRIQLNRLLIESVEKNKTDLNLLVNPLTHKQGAEEAVDTFLEQFVCSLNIMAFQRNDMTFLTCDMTFGSNVIEHKTSCYDKKVITPL